jgi:hypothetical protein
VKAITTMLNVGTPTLNRVASAALLLVEKTKRPQMTIVQRITRITRPPNHFVAKSNKP